MILSLAAMAIIGLTITFDTGKAENIQGYPIPASLLAQPLTTVHITSATPSAAGVSEPANALDLNETEKIAEEAYIYGFPIVMNYNIMYTQAVDRTSGQYLAPFNTLYNAHHLFTSNETTINTPNSETLYSIIWMDLRAEPVVLTVPPIENRYYSIMLCDGNTYNYGYIGSRATGDKAGSYLVAGPDWRGEKPADIEKVFRSRTPFSFAWYRTQLFNSTDMPNVIAIQKRYRAQTVSRFLNQSAPPPAPVIDFPHINESLVNQTEFFFEYLNFLLPFLPSNHSKDSEIRSKLARIGIGPEKRFGFSQRSPSHQNSIVRGQLAARRKIKATIDNAGKSVNGWRVSEGGGDLERYNGNWLHRAAIAAAGIYANDADEAVYPIATRDKNGQWLDGRAHNYTLTFSNNSFPPAKAFWSVTMYDGNTRLLIKNPFSTSNRFLINSPMLPSLIRNADGSVTIYIQYHPPSEDKLPNWLPAPNGPIYLVMRIYWPTKTPPSILPPGSGTWRPPPIEVA